MEDLSRQHQQHTAIMVFKCLHGLAPDYLNSKFQLREDTYGLRNSNAKLNIPLPRTDYYKNSIRYRGAVLWNSLPKYIRQIDSLKLSNKQ